METHEKRNKMLIDNEGFMISQKLTEVEDYSDEVNEILSHPPTWIIKYGITIFFVIFMTVLSGVYFIQYADIRTGEIIVSDVIENSNNSPAENYVVQVKMLCPEGIKAGEQINLKMNEFSNHGYQELSGKLKSETFNKRQQIYTLEIALPIPETNNGRKDYLTRGAKGIGRISLGKISLFKKIMEKLSLLY
jgi:hypothetical protein